VAHDWGSIQSGEAVTCGDLDGRLASFTSISGPSFDHAGRWLRAHANPRGVAALLNQGVKSTYIAVFQLPVLAPAFWRLGGARLFRRGLARVEGAPVDAAWPSPQLASDGARGVRLYRANAPVRLSRPQPRRTDIPVQLVVPTGDPFVSRKLLDGLEALAPNLRRRDVPGKHWIIRTHPERVARWAAEHIAAVEAGEPPAARPPVVVVTGAGSGIGRETALAFADRGAHVVAVDIDADAAARTAELCRVVGGTAEDHAVDVGDAAAMEALAKAVGDEHVAPDVVVNNAGIGMAGPLLDTTVDDWDRVLHVNLWGVEHGSRLFGAQMVARGEGGHIVNTASAAAFTPSRTYGAYATTKAAVLMLTECLRAELAAEGIGVSAICPGIVDTGIIAATRFVGTSDEEQARRRSSTARLYRLRGFTPDKVAKAIVRAVDRDAAVVPVAADARIGQLANRFTPGLARRFARVDLSPK
jgi:NAD(P)-dependent dehydrogenase (short-subunit alcohol dehydrogenase family)